MSEAREKLNIKVNFSYPYSEEFEYIARLTRINLDEERKNDIRTDNGFIITEPRGIKKDVKDPNGIFSTRFGQTLQDVNAFADRYKCECGHTKGRFYNNTKCPICGTRVRFIDDNFEYFGWICLEDPYYIIHPNIYASIANFFGNNKTKQKRLDNMIHIEDNKDEDGHSIEKEFNEDEPFYGIGMIGFKEKFDEIMSFYLKKFPNKKDVYDNIMGDRDKVFIQSIPVYTTQLRPFKIEGGTFNYEKVNNLYNVMAKLAATVNKDTTDLFKKEKPKNLCLQDIQDKYNALYKEIIKILANKKGEIRLNFGGRYNFTARDVIAQDPKLQIDQIRLPYHALVELLQPSIINILKKTHNITYSDAYKIWFKAQIEKDNRVWKIIQNMIDGYHGLPMLINRNPTINYGSIMFMRCIGINDNFTMSIPLQILKPLGADFDGDALNILYLINKAFVERADEVFNPRNAMMISHNDGEFNAAMNHQRDTLINANTMVRLSRKYYSQEQLDKIARLKSMM